MSANRERSDAWFERACAVLPGGVSSPVRSFAAVGGRPRVIARAHGAHLVDVDGNVLIDCIGAWGAAIAGHAHAAVVEAIARAARDGTSFGTCSRGEVALAERVIERMPSIERLRFVNSGTEAATTAIRLARAATGRPLILKFDGCYHGHADALLSRAGSGAATFGVPDSAGVPGEVAGRTLVAPFNDLEAVDAIVAEHGPRLAAVVVEPVCGNMGLVPPAPGFLAGLRASADRCGAILIFDEVMTGFRVAAGGAQARFGVRPDLTLLGKVLGGGLPVGAVGGPARLMERLAPLGPVYSAGTFSGNPLTMAAGCATLDLLDAAAYQRLERSASRLERGLGEALRGSRRPACAQRAGSMLSVFFGRTAVRTMAEARACDHHRFARFFHAMLERGVHLPPGGYEAWFLSLAHDDAAVDAVVGAATEAVRVADEEATATPSPSTPESPEPPGLATSLAAVR